MPEFVDGLYVFTDDEGRLWGAFCHGHRPPGVLLDMVKRDHDGDYVLNELEADYQGPVRAEDQDHAYIRHKPSDPDDDKCWYYCEAEEAGAQPVTVYRFRHISRAWRA